jgi:DNA-binding beta-propeller fold protein YncE
LLDPIKKEPFCLISRVTCTRPSPNTGNPTTGSKVCPSRLYNIFTFHQKFIHFLGTGFVKQEYNFKTEIGVHRRPMEIVIDETDNLIANCEDSSLQTFQNNDQLISSFSIEGRAGRDVTQFGTLILCPSGPAMISCSSVRFFDRALQMELSSFDLPELRPSHLYGVAVDLNGHFLIGLVDKILVVNLMGVLVRKINNLTSPDDVYPCQPYGICVDFNANLYVCDGKNNNIKIFTADGTLIHIFGSQGTSDGCFMTPHGIAVGREGKIIIADSQNNRIQIFSPKGQFLMNFGSLGENEGQMEDPLGVVLDKEGNILVVDYQNFRIQIFG